MKVVLQGNNVCCQNKAGGLQSRIRKIAYLLKVAKVDIELFNSFSTKLEKCDILHIFMLSLDNFNLIKYAKKKGVKVVMSTVVPIDSGVKLKIYKAIYRIPIVTTYKLLLWSLQMSDLLIVETKKESQYLQNYYNISKKKIKIIPNGVDLNEYTGEEIYDSLGLKNEYILQVGRFDKNKNQINVINAMKDTGIDIVFIGGPGIGDDEYYQRCLKQAEGYSNIHFLGWVENSALLLKSAYAHAKLVVLPSYFETFGLVAIEGGAAGANLAFSKSLPILDFNVFDNCERFDPSNVSEIKQALITAFKRPNDIEFTNKLIETFNWDQIIQEHINLYEDLLK